MIYGAPMGSAASATALVVAAGGVFGTAAARAQSGPPPMPVAVDVKKVPIGSYADYTLTVGGGQMKVRYALVARRGGSATFEIVTGLMSMQVVTEGDPGSPGAVRKALLKMGNREPWEGAGMKPFRGVDPKSLLGAEEIRVPAGTFRTEHHRERAEGGGTVDFWVSKDVMPIGLVKQTTTPSAGGRAGSGHRPTAAMTIELLSRGSDARPVIALPAPAAPAGAPARKK